MYILYVDNYRGFKNSIIPLYDVNFFVGENSTGKTSILSLLTLVSNNSFWFTSDFNTDDIQLGSYQNISSKSDFTIGFYTHNPDQESKENFLQSFIFRYVNDDGISALKESLFFVNNTIHFALFDYNTIKYSIIDNIKLNNADAFKNFEQILDYWKKRDYTDNKGTSASISASRFTPRFAYKTTTNNSPAPTPLLPIILNWNGPIRTKPKNLYIGFKIPTGSEGEHIPYYLKYIIENRNNNEEFLKNINNFGKESGLFDEIGIKKYGKLKYDPFEINIKFHKKPYNILYVGYGVSQILPILVGILGEGEGEYYAIQQPEVHLHPKAQSAFGDLIYYLSSKEDKKFLIETHSDFIIDRFRLALKKSDIKNIKAQVLYFTREQNLNKVYPIEILQNGKYSKNQPKKFKEFFIKETMEMLDI